MRILICIALAILMLASCTKEAARGRIAIYQLSSYQMSAGNCQVVAGTAVLESQPFVDDRDIVKYDRSNYSYRFTQHAADKLNKTPARTPLAITVDGEVIFIFTHMPLFMSSVCAETITMRVSDNDVRMDLVRFPAGMSTIPAITDTRNHEKIINILAAQGKLQ